MTKGFVAFSSMSGETLDRITIDPILDTHNKSSNRFLVRYQNQTSQLLLQSSQRKHESESELWIYVEFPEDVANMCLLKESAKIFVCTKTQLSFLGYASHSPRHWYSIQSEGAKQMRLNLQNHAKVPSPVLFPVYSSIPIYSRAAETSNLDISNISLDNCRRIPWNEDEAQAEVILI